MMSFRLLNEPSGHMYIYTSGGILKCKWKSGIVGGDEVLSLPQNCESVWKECMSVHTPTGQQVSEG